MQKNRRLIFLMLMLLVLGFIIKLWYNKKQTIFSQASLTKVQTVRVKKMLLPEMVDTVGHLIAVQDVVLRSGVVGRVQTLEVDAGSWVDKGQRLVTVIPHTEIRAPFSGYLADWQVKVGEQVTVGTPLIQLVNTEKFLVEYRLPEQYAGKLQRGQKVLLTFHHGAEVEGRVIFVSPLIDKKSYTIFLKAEIGKVNGLLLPGMSAHIRHTLFENQDALVIPESSLIPTLHGYEIYKVVSGKLVKEKVQVGNRLNGRVQLLSGVLENEQVLAVHTPMLKEELAVQAVDWVGDW